MAALEALQGRAFSNWQDVAFDSREFRFGYDLDFRYLFYVLGLALGLTSGFKGWLQKVAFRV